MSIGARIVDARKQKGMTQVELAVCLGVSRAAVGQWELSATSPSTAKLEEVAIVLEVAPEWLAYGVTPSEGRAKYRGPEPDNISWISEVIYCGDLSKPVEQAAWGIPTKYLSDELQLNVHETVIISINSDAVEPEFLYGDKAFVDTGDSTPSPAGIFCYWDGIGISFARFMAIPGRSSTVRVSAKGSHSMDVALRTVQIIGRAKARVQTR